MKVRYLSPGAGQRTHTPGEWYSSEGYPLVHPCGLATVGTKHGVFSYHKPSGDHAADARLMAAAPKLLELCEKALEALPGDHALRRELHRGIGAALGVDMSGDER